MQPSRNYRAGLINPRLLWNWQLDWQRTATILAAVVLASGCVGDDTPGPVKLERASPFERDVPKQQQRDPDSPLRNPAHQTPDGPDGAQLPEPELEAALAEAAKHAAVGDVAQQRIALSQCANKTPPSARCDGELGLSMVDFKHRRAVALYHLVAAANVDDANADGSLYARVGQALSGHGKLAESVAAFERAVARDANAEHLFLLGQSLSLMPGRLLEAADHMALARAKDDRMAWLHDEAVIRGQIPAREQAEAALALFRLYVERAATAPADQLPTPPERLTGRIAELERLAKQYPTQAQWQQQRETQQTAEQASAAAAASDGPS
jgi:tetratricopeptide (TPR) repeat protein